MGACKFFEPFCKKAARQTNVLFSEGRTWVAGRLRLSGFSEGMVTGLLHIEKARGNSTIQTRLQI